MIVMIFMLRRGVPAYSLGKKKNGIFDKEKREPCLPATSEGLVRSWVEGTCCEKRKWSRPGHSKETGREKERSESAHHQRHLL